MTDNYAPSTTYSYGHCLGAGFLSFTKIASLADVSEAFVRKVKKNLNR
ncbi:hypothetical protein [Parafilimonas sp.]